MGLPVRSNLVRRAKNGNSSPVNSMGRATGRRHRRRRRASCWASRSHLGTAHLAQQTQGLRMVVGVDQWRRPVAVDLADHPVMMWVGPSGKGKTSAMKSTLFALAARNSPQRFHFVVFDQKVAGCLAIVTDPKEAEDALIWETSTLLTRRTRDGVSTPSVVFIVDDLVNLLAKSPGIVGPLVELASQGRAAGLYSFIGTQQAGSKTGIGSTVVEDNITARIVFRSSSATSGARAAGAGKIGAEQLSGAKGDALLIVDDRAVALLPHPRRVASPLGKPF